MPTVLDTYIENREQVQPTHANNYESVHGGHVMKWMDEVGALSAMRFAGEPCVTAHVDEVDFLRPVPVGETVLVESYVYAAGRTSARVRLRAYRENPRTGETQLTTESLFVFVAIDENGEPTPVPELEVRSDRGEALRQNALDAESEANGNGAA